MKTNDSEQIASALVTLAENYIGKKEYDTAIVIIKKSFLFPKAANDYVNFSWLLNDLAQIFLATNQHDSARHYARQAVELAGGNGLKDQLLRAYEYLYKSYEKTDTKDSVYKYFRLAINTKDSLFTSKKQKRSSHSISVNKCTNRKLNRIKYNYKIK
jgi:tetratricopeptide (TPR) repeat protein